jgi:nanoRNase/pAp phosphatase (c-di-AMP/oligoRNAs hydrolase)
VINPDVCVLVADFCMRVDTARWSIVSGIYEKTLVVIFRNNDFQQNAGKIAKTAFSNFGSAGGHKSAARAEIKLSEIAGLVDVKDSQSLAKWVVNKVEKAIRKKRS